MSHYRLWRLPACKAPQTFTIRPPFVFLQSYSCDWRLSHCKKYPEMLFHNTVWVWVRWISALGCVPGRRGGHRLEIWLRLTERTPAVTTASRWMGRFMKWALASPSTLLASCYTSPQGVSCFDAAQETPACCVAESVQCDSPQQLTGVWVRSWVKAKGLSE